MPTPIDKDSSDRFGRSDRSGAFGDEADQSDEVGRLELSHNCVSFWKLAVPMRVLQFFKTYYPDSYGGTEQAIFQLSQAMSANDVETDVLSLSSNPARRPASIGNHRAHYAKLNFEIASTGISFGAIREFCRLAAEADIVHYHYPWPYMDVVHFIARSKKPAVITYHSDIIRQKRLRVIYRPLEKLFFNSADAIVSTSPNYTMTSPILRRYQDKLHVIPIGAFGIFLLEGAMFAKPLISSEIGTGTSYVNIDGETGIVIQPSDPSALRRAMDYIWTHPDEAARFGKNSRLRYETFFTAQAMARGYLSLYRSIIAERHVDARSNLNVWAKS